MQSPAQHGQIEIHILGIPILIGEGHRNVVAAIRLQIDGVQAGIHRALQQWEDLIANRPVIHSKAVLVVELLHQPGKSDVVIGSRSKLFPDGAGPWSNQIAKSCGVPQSSGV